MTPLRAKYIRDLVIHGRSKHTQEAYTRYVCDLARYYRRSPELISYGEVTGWLYYLITECQLSASSVNIAVSAVRFLYAVTLGRETLDLMASVSDMKRATGRADSEVEAILTPPRQPRGRPMTPLRAKYIRDLVIRGRSKHTQEAYTRYVRDLARYYRRSPELISYEEVTGWLYHLIKERQLSASSVNIAVSAVRFLYAVTLGRETLDLMASVSHMKRATQRAEVSSLRAQRGRSDLDCAQTAARPGALDDGLWLRAANFGGHTAQDQRHRPRPYAVASTQRQGRQGTRSAFERTFAQRVRKLLASATSG